MATQFVLLGGLEFYEPFLVAEPIDNLVVGNCRQLPVSLDGQYPRQNRVGKVGRDFKLPAGRIFVRLFESKRLYIRALILSMCRM